MNRRTRFIYLVLLSLAIGCGESNNSPQSSPTTSIIASPSPSTTPSQPPAPPKDWKTYKDSDYPFSVRYPPNFFYEAGKGSPDFEGILRRARFCDEKFKDAFPDGQVLVGLYVRDTASLDEWLTAHSGDASADNPKIYYHDTANKTQVEANNREALAFDWTSAEGSIIHVTAFFSGDRVVTFEWFADSADYEATIHPIFETMLSSFED